jgi:hypothetical protein
LGPSVSLQRQKLEHHWLYGDGKSEFGAKREYQSLVTLHLDAQNGSGRPRRRHAVD